MSLNGWNDDVTACDGVRAFLCASQRSDVPRYIACSRGSVQLFVPCPVIMSRVDNRRGLSSPKPQADAIDNPNTLLAKADGDGPAFVCCSCHVREARQLPVRSWPVPQIIVEFRDMQMAWGRQAVQMMGYTVSPTVYLLEFIFVGQLAAFTSAHVSNRVGIQGGTGTDLLRAS